MTKKHRPKIKYKSDRKYNKINNKHLSLNTNKIKYKTSNATPQSWGLDIVVLPSYIGKPPLTQNLNQNAHKPQINNKNHSPRHKKSIKPFQNAGEHIRTLRRNLVTFYGITYNMMISNGLRIVNCFNVMLSVWRCMFLCKNIK
ncbi:MAG: hypothetical protein EB154_10005 [Nitrosopumilaceae archaeon]|nr:hypothetical protein [Nitrosopumilaceae archaeon]